MPFMMPKLSKTMTSGATLRPTASANLAAKPDAGNVETATANPCRLEASRKCEGTVAAGVSPRQGEPIFQTRIVSLDALCDEPGTPITPASSAAKAKMRSDIRPLSCLSATPHWQLSAWECRPANRSGAQRIKGMLHERRLRTEYQGLRCKSSSCTDPSREASAWVQPQPVARSKLPPRQFRLRSRRLQVRVLSGAPAFFDVLRKRATSRSIRVSSATSF